MAKTNVRKGWTRRADSIVLMNIFNLLHDHYGDLHWWPGETPFEIMVGAILTQNAAWTNVEKAIANLKKANVLTPRKLHALPERKLAKLIRPSGFFNVKAKRLKSFLNYLSDRYKFNLNKLIGKGLTELRTELLSVPGIGKETADCILLYAAEKPTFVVDAYTKRILSRHGLINAKDEYDEVKNLFERNLRSNTKLFNEYHAQIVMCGKDFCKPTPRCDRCPLNRIPFAVKK